MEGNVKLIYGNLWENEARETKNPGPWGSRARERRSQSRAPIVWMSVFLQVVGGKPPGLLLLAELAVFLHPVGTVQEVAMYPVGPSQCAFLLGVFHPGSGRDERSRMVS